MDKSQNKIVENTDTTARSDPGCLAQKMNEFVKRKIDVIFNIGEGEKGEKPGENIRVSGLRVAARVEYYNAAVQAEAHLRIYGLKQSLMNYLTGTGFNATEIRNNTVVIQAGNEGGIMSTVYQGNIWRSYADYSGTPDVSLNVHCLASCYDAVKPYPSRSYKGTVDVAAILSEIARDLNLGFVNDGVNAKLTDQHLTGTAIEQIRQCAQAADISYVIQYGELVIYPKNKSREGPPVVLVTKQTGMVGYPAVSSRDISVTTLFNPSLAVGKRAFIQSEMMVANGEWAIVGITHALESEIPGGAWFSHIQCMRVAEK